jgi:hypothetical protein
MVHKAIKYKDARKMEAADSDESVYVNSRMGLIPYNND